MFRIILVAISANYFLQSAHADWEYSGYSGSNNQIKVNGPESITTAPYPKNWEFGEKDKTTCLCSPKTDAELQNAVAKAFGKENAELVKSIKSGTKLEIFSDSGTPQIEVYGLFLTHSKLQEQAYTLMKSRLTGNDYAFVKNPKGIYFAKKAPHVPARAFLHFIRGYDDTASR